MDGTLQFQWGVLALGTIVFLAVMKVVVRYLETRRPRQPIVELPNDLAARLDRIEQIVESTAIEVERVAEANRFMSKLLADRIAIEAPPRVPERVITPH